MAADDGAGGDRKRSTSGSTKEQSASPKKRKTKVFDIDLPNAPIDGKFVVVLLGGSVLSRLKHVTTCIYYVGVQCSFGRSGWFRHEVRIKYFD